MADISNNPHRWLLPFWADLNKLTFFANLAPELQAGALAAALETDYPAKAQEIREWNPVTRRAMLAVLDESLKAGNPARETELWRLRKGERELRCVAVYLPNGIDLRALQDGRMHRTELFTDGASVLARARQWRQKSVKAGWGEAEQHP